VGVRPQFSGGPQHSQNRPADTPTGYNFGALVEILLVPQRVQLDDIEIIMDNSRPPTQLGTSHIIR
jgi:hypothetical protein